MRGLIGALCAVGCGRIGFDQIGTGGDGTPLGEARAVGAGAGTSCAVLVDGSLWCWGSIVGRRDVPQYSTPVEVDASRDWASVSIGTDLNLALKTDGSLYGWTIYDTVLFPDGTLASDRVPQRIGTDTWSSIALRTSGGCGIHTGGALYCWGENIYGTVGDGTTQDAYGAVKVGAVPFQGVAGNHHTMCAIDTTAHLWCWGFNAQGQAGFAPGTDIRSPMQVGVGTWRAVAPGLSLTCGIASDGTLWCWGTGYGAPTLVDARTDWTSVAAPFGGACAIRDSQLWCIGQNRHGTLGAGDVESLATLTQIDPGHAFAAVSGDFTTCAIRDGQPACTGDGASGALGDGAWRFSPGIHEPVAGSWLAQSVGDQFACGIRDDHVLLCWGNGLGNALGMSGDASVPRAVDANTWNDVGAGSLGAYAVHSDGSLWAWGFDVVNSSYATPTRIVLYSSSERRVDTYDRQ